MDIEQFTEQFATFFKHVKDSKKIPVMTVDEAVKLFGIFQLQTIDERLERIEDSLSELVRDSL